MLQVLIRRVFASLRRRARRQRPIEDPQCGAVTFVQRFGGALNLNVHFHTLALDGVYDARAGMRFRALAPPDDDEVARVTESVVRGIARLLERRGLGPDDDEIDPVAHDEPLLAALYSASVRGRIATGSRAGQPVSRFGDRVEIDQLPVSRGQRCASFGGASLHANVAVPARDRQRLERLCRYAARPPLAIERLSRLDDGRLLYELKQPWRDGTTHIGFEPLELLEKLAALVPPPRVNLVRYHGVLAPAARHRAQVIPSGPAPEPRPAHGGCERIRQGDEPSDTEKSPPRPRNYTWAELMRRVFEVDVLVCSLCSGPMRVLAAIHPPEATQAILDCLGLPSRAPPVSPAEPDFTDPCFEVF
ncbi:MAG: transposase [Planctomycetota bacterium]